MDASAAALDVARANAERLGLAVEFVQGDWWRPLVGRRFDLAAEQPALHRRRRPAPGALRHEPLQALTPGGDGLAAIEQIVCRAPAHLLPGGWLLLEHGHDQAVAVRQRLLASRIR